MPNYVNQVKRLAIVITDRAGAAYDPTASVVVFIEPPGAAGTTLASALTAGATTASLTNASGFPDSGEAIVDDELIRYTGKSGNSLTGLTRGLAGTTAAAHVSGAIISELAVAVRTTADVTSPFTLAKDSTGNYHALYKPTKSGRFYYDVRGVNTDATKDSQAPSSYFDVEWAEALNV